MINPFAYTQKGGKDWFLSDAYDDNAIESIKDPEGGVAISMPTAIPSPFARIDLVKTAFINICKSPNLKSYSKDGIVVASRSDEKLVSDALDLAEIMFNVDYLKDKIKVLVWDKEEELDKLSKSSDMHRRLAETLQLYLDQDRETYNFDLHSKFYIIQCNNKTIGATSPATLFFATANDLSHAQLSLTKSDKTFDEEYKSLYERDPEFQRYLYLLFKANPLLKRKLVAIEDYLNKNLKLLDKYNNKLYQEINSLNIDEFSARYEDLSVDTNRNNIIEVLGIGLKKRRKTEISESIATSDFIINSNKLKDNFNKPLVLQNGFNKKLKYVNDLWSSSYKVPYFNFETSLEKRKLPHTEITYPYLTVSDFLEPYLIRLVYPINRDKYFDGNISDVRKNSKDYLLPLKPLFFKYFNAADLYSSVSNSPKIFIEPGLAEAVKVSLQIPISKSGEYISFERTYHMSNIDGVNEENNLGVIVEHQVGLTIFPFIKTGIPEIKPEYRIQLIDRDVTGEFKNSNFNLKFYSDSNEGSIEVTDVKTRSKKVPNEGQTATTQYYILEKEFDLIQLKNISSPGASGFIIPKWPVYQQGNDVFSFAIDFGTTNTHIEYQVNNSLPKPFDITSEDVQIATLFHPTETNTDFLGSGAVAIRELIDHQFLPSYIGKDSEYKFPHRTVLAESPTLDLSQATYTLADFNIPFIYERQAEKEKINTNLKWSKNDVGNEKRIKAYFTKIILLLRNKVLFNKGNLALTKIVWFYPSSMKPGRQNTLQNIWNKLFNEYFTNQSTPIRVSESLAPFFYFRGSGELTGGTFKPVVSVDIGGGTTDVVVFKSSKPLAMTSFKFAANSIFGDGYTEYGNANSNGLVLKYLPYYKNLLGANKQYNLLKVLDSISAKNKTEDLNAFFFSIANNTNIKEKSLFSYNDLLCNDEDIKIIFIYFYSAILYHIAEWMKKESIEFPKNIVFSGTGSKLLNIISPSDDMLKKLSHLIFESVYNPEINVDKISVKLEKEKPKEITCKGGLMMKEEDYDNPLQTSIHNYFSNTNDLKFEDLHDDSKDIVVDNIKRFNDLFIQISEQFNFTDNFNVSHQSLVIFKEEVNNHLRDYLEEGLSFSYRLEDSDRNENKINETLFFYPLVGTINSLLQKLSRLNPLNT